MKNQYKILQKKDLNDKITYLCMMEKNKHVTNMFILFLFL